MINHRSRTNWPRITMCSHIIRRGFMCHRIHICNQVSFRFVHLQDKASKGCLIRNECELCTTVHIHIGYRQRHGKFSQRRPDGHYSRRRHPNRPRYPRFFNDEFVPPKTWSVSIAPLCQPSHRVLSQAVRRQTAVFHSIRIFLCMRIHRKQQTMLY